MDVPLYSDLIKQKTIDWWLEINTTIPECTYYFGPFNNAKEATLSQYGYIEDLLGEQARGITVEVKQCQPDRITIFEEN